MTAKDLKKSVTWVTVVERNTKLKISNIVQNFEDFADFAKSSTIDSKDTDFAKFVKSAKSTKSNIAQKNRDRKVIIVNNANILNNINTIAIRKKTRTTMQMYIC